MLVADPAQALEESARGRDETTLALLHLDDDRGDLLGRNLGREEVLELAEGRFAVRAAVVGGERCAVDLGCERPHAELVGVRLRGERHRHQRAAVEGALECDHGGATRVEPRELDCVLDRLGACVEEHRLRGAFERRQREQPLGERDVDLVRDDREIGVREALELLLCGRDDLRMRMADVEDADAAGEVEEDVAVDVGERRSARLGDDDRQGDRLRIRDHALLALEDLLRARARDRGADVDRLGRRHVEQVSAATGRVA